MTALGAWPVQTALVAALRGNPAIAAAVSGVFDSVPENVAFPFIVVGEGTETDASSFAQRGHEVHPEIQIWTYDGEAAAPSVGAAGYKVGLGIAELIVDLIETNGLTVDGHDSTVLFLEELDRQRPSPDDPSLRLVSPKLKILLEDTA